MGKERLRRKSQNDEEINSNKGWVHKKGSMVKNERMTSLEKKLGKERIKDVEKNQGIQKQSMIRNLISKLTAGWKAYLRVIK